MLSAAVAVTLAWTEVVLGTAEAQEARTGTPEWDAAARQQLAVSASEAARRTTDMLQMRGLLVESSLNLA